MQARRARLAPRQHVHGQQVFRMAHALHLANISSHKSLVAYVYSDFDVHGNALYCCQILPPSVHTQELQAVGLTGLNN